MTSEFDGIVRLSEAMRNVPEIVDKAADEIGTYLVETVRNRVRLGYGVKAHGEKKDKFKELAESTIEHRKLLSLRGELFPGSKPKRSHLTATGEMMGDLAYQKEPGRVVLFFDGNDANYKAWYNNEAGRVTRPFFFLTDLEMKAVNRTLQKSLDEYIEGLAGTL